MLYKFVGARVVYYWAKQKMYLSREAELIKTFFVPNIYQKGWC